MSFTTRQIIGKPPPITFVMRKREGASRRPMFCPTCGGNGKPMEYTYEEIVMIIEGVAARTAVLREIKCRVCPQIIEIC